MYVFLVTLLLYTTLVESDSDTKYIDLLPEKEKEEFLENIARRILEEVEIKSEKHEKSVEVSESQLDKQNDFVHNILQEENEKLRKANITYTLDSNTNTSFSPLALREDENKQQQYVDLTLRTEFDKNRSKRDSKRRVFTGFATDEKSNEDFKDNKTEESELDVQVRNFQQKSADNDDEIKFNDLHVTEKSEKLTTEKITAKLQNNADKNNITDIIRRIYEDDEPHTEITTEKILDNRNVSTVDLETSDTYQTTLSNDDRSEIETSTIESTDNYFTTEITASESIPYEVIQETFHPLENTTFDERMPEIEIENGNLRAYRQYDLEETVVLRNSNTTNYVNVTETVQNSVRNSTQSLNKTNADSNDHEEDSKVINIDVITIAPIEPTIQYDNNNTESDFLEQTTQKIQVLTTITQKLDSNLYITSDITTISSDSKRTNINDATESVTDDSKVKPIFAANIGNSTKLLLNGVMKSLRDNLIINGKKEDKSNVKPIQGYNVYEIAPDATPFVKRDIPKEKQSLQKSEFKNLNKRQPNTLIQLKKKSINTETEETIVQEEPYHVPIYNYQPKNAFYNLNDVFEPNSNKYVEDDEEKSRYDDDDKESSINIKNNYQQMPVPIYVYAPLNAFYDPNNNFGPNQKDQDVIEDIDIDLNPEGSEEYGEESERSNKEREQIEYQYHNDPHKKKPGNVKVLNIKNNLESEKLTLINLTSFLKDLVLQGKIKSGPKIKNTPDTTVEDILSKDLDWDSKKQKALLRCLYKKKCGQGQDSDEKDKSKEDEEIVDPEEGFHTALSKARHMMLLSGHYVLDSKKTNFSRLDEFFESSERVNEKEENEDDKDQSDDDKNKKYKRVRTILRSLLEKNYLLNRKFPENQNLDIAMDYYFEEPKRTREKKHRNIVTPKIALILDKHNNHENKRKQENIGSSKIALLYKNKDPNEKEIKALRDKLRPNRKPDKHYEYLLIKELADEIPDANIEQLYWQLEFIDKLNLRLNSDQNISKELDVFVEVLGDMVMENNKGLLKYDWLGTAVDLQTAIKKMTYMVEQVQNEEDIHPSDLELLKYLVWLHTFAKEELSLISLPKELRGLNIATGKKHRGKIIRESGLLYRDWLNRVRPKPIRDEELENFQEFVEQLQNSLHDLHTALKYIAMVTKYKHQKWFENLKQIHVENSRKRILELLIHLSGTRLIATIEESSKNGLENNFKKYLKTHEKEIEKTREEFIFVLSLIGEYAKLNK